MNFLSTALCLFFLSVSSFSLSQEAPASEEPTVIIWDLGGVLTEVSWVKYAYHIGFSPFLCSLLWDWSSPAYTCKTRCFQLLDRVEFSCKNLPDGVCIPGDVPMPLLMIAYQAGFLKREDILPLVKATASTLEQEGFFKSSFEKALILRTIDEIFNPDTLAACHYVVPEGLEMIRRLAAQKSCNGHQKYKLYILSNWDPFSFILVRKKSDHLFSLFDGSVVSGLVGMVKPSHELFDYCIQKYSIDKSRCIFVDDQKENIEAARLYGIKHTIHFKNFTQLKEDLAGCGVQV